MTTARSRSAAMARNPPEISAAKFSLRGSSSGSALVGRSGSSRTGIRMPRTRTVDQAKVAALRKKTVWTSVAAMSTAPSVGPTKNERLSSVLPVPFDAVSSSGVLASAGISARWAQRNGVPSRPARVASTKIGAAGVSRTRHSPAATTRTSRIRSAPTMTLLRGSRSASMDARGAVKAIRVRRIAVHTPTAVTPPTPYAHTVTAVANAQSPINEPASASSTRRRPGFRNTDPIEAPMSRSADRPGAFEPLLGVGSWSSSVSGRPTVVTVATLGAPRRSGRDRVRLSPAV